MSVVTKAEIQSVTEFISLCKSLFSSSYNDVGNLYIHGNINKWAKNKPIRYNKWTQLSDAERAGSTSDHSDGYYYGVKVLQNGASYMDLHDVSFDYARPRGASQNEPFRREDIVGYDSAARPTMQGYFDTTQYRDLANNMRITINIDTSGNNTTGIDIADIVQKASGLQLSTCYPFILVGTYMAALKNEDTNDGMGNYKVTPIYYQSAWQRNFIANLKALRDDFGLALGEIKITTFLVPYSQGSLVDITGAWVNLAAGSGSQIFGGPAFPLPEATGLDVTIADYGSYAVKAKASISGTTVALAVVTTWPEGEPTETTTVEITARLSAGTPQSKSWTYQPGGITVIQSFTWQSLGIINPSSGQTINNISIIIRTKTETGSSWTYGEGITNGSVTIQ